MDNLNLVAEAAKSKLGIVALLFVIAGTLARVFFGTDTPLKIRIIMFSAVLIGLSGFAAAILVIESPDKLDSQYGISQKRVDKLSQVLSEFKQTQNGCVRASDNSSDSIASLLNEAHPPGVSNWIVPFDFSQARGNIDNMKDCCDKLGELARNLRIDFSDLPEVVSARAREAQACSTRLAQLRGALAKIPTSEEEANQRVERVR